jgi:hypothetical protein
MVGIINSCIYNQFYQEYQDNPIKPSKLLNNIGPILANFGMSEL